MPGQTTDRPNRVPPSQSHEGDEAAVRLLGILQGLIDELHSGRGGAFRAGLNSFLDRDLGFDSLTRVELLKRLESAFEVRLPERVLAEADTPKDLLAAVLAAGPVIELSGSAEIRLPSEEVGEAAAESASTLLEALDWHARRHPDRIHVVLIDESAGETPLTYGRLAAESRMIAAGLLRNGLEPGDRVALMLPTGEDFLRSFFGILYAGGTPAPIYPPMRASQIEDHLRRQAAILDNAQATILITAPELKAAAAILKPLVHTLRSALTPRQLTQGGPLPRLRSRAADIALLQYTSGSTGNPKGVVLSHANLLANIRAMAQSLAVDSSDVFVSWLPLYHDMGLIGAWLGSLYSAMPLVLMSPLSFLARPESWLHAISRHRATLSAAPNFAFEFCVSKIDDAGLEGLDLTSLRAVMNGAEPVVPDTLRRFAERFSAYGFRPEAMSPVYGLAENSVGLAFPRFGCQPLVDRVNRDALVGLGLAETAAPDDANAIECVACGHALPGHDLRIVDSRGAELRERREGRLQFRGPSATSGYFRNDEETRNLRQGEWYETGDLAYMAGSDVYITGRSKDLIIRAGRNVYPQELEAAVGDIEGVRKGCVAVFGSPDRRSGTERLVVLAETRETDDETRAALRRRITTVAAEILDSPPDEVVLAPPRTAPKTSSGKIRRSAARDLYESGGLASGPHAIWWQLTRLSVRAFYKQTAASLRTALERAYGVYFWAVLTLGLLAATPLLAVLPGADRRFTVVRRAARLTLWLTGVPLDVDGQDRLPERGGLLAANHSSYLDGMVLVAALPGRSVFVAKSELASAPFVGWLLRRLDTLFVERVDIEGSVAAGRETIAALQSGKRLLFFPEGTFTDRPGLLEFRLGAFVTAAEAGERVIPVTLRGTRAMLRDGQWLPRPGLLSVQVSDGIAPDGSDFSAAVRLRDRVRAEILERCGEPDRSDRHVVFHESGIEHTELNEGR